MKNRIRYLSLFPAYTLIIVCILLLAIGGNQAVTVISVNAPVTNRTTVVIDAGHGGFDGGAVSCTGIYESQFNLEIALRLNDLMHLLGIDTVMIRDSDDSVHTSGVTISQKKVSDLRERVRIVNTNGNSLLISIHQNQFSDSKYSGAQVFFAPNEASKTLAHSMQSALIQAVNDDSRRQIKKADGIYLMQHIRCPGILVECGFLSNPQEEYKLRTPSYQKKLCAVIACTTSSYLFGT